MKEENRFVKLSRKDVSEGVERKGNLDFLSWGVSWTKLCEEGWKVVEVAEERMEAAAEW